MNLSASKKQRLLRVPKVFILIWIILTSISVASATQTKQSGGSADEIGDIVWVDTDRNGLQDGGEFGLSNVTVTLHDMDDSGAQVGSAITDSAGNYYFGGASNQNMNASIQPVTKTIEVQIDRGSDDGQEFKNFSFVYLNETDIEVTDPTPATDILAGFRFNALTIPQGVTITNAYIQFQTDNSPANNGTSNISIQGEDVDNAVTFTTFNDDISLRPLTTASVTGWAPPLWTIANERGVNQRTPDISTIVQEIIDRGGWASGNSMAFVLDGTGEREAESYDGNATGAASIFIEYEEDQLVTETILADRNYELRIDTTQTAISTPDYVLSPEDVAQPANGNASDTSNDSSTDIADSDAVLSGDNAVIVYTTGSVGEENFGLDFGFMPKSVYDWGDLPDGDAGASTDNYATNNTDGGEGIGASHLVVTDMYLGSCVDAHVDATPSAAGSADQDDTDGSMTDVEGTCTTAGDDEDGIVFTTPIVAGAQACVDITVSSVAANGVVNAWIDFNGNGVLNDAGEQVFTDLDVGGGIGAGTFEHCFTVPASASITHDGDLYSRFRLNDDGFAPDDSTALAPTGPADTGEVEDYALQPYCVGNFLWIDDGTTDNVQDNGDTPVTDGVAVNLVWAGADGDMSLTADNITYATTTDINGKYHFCGLLPNLDGDATADDYQIIVPTLPASTSNVVTADQGGDDTADSDGVAANGNAAESPIFDVPTGNESPDAQNNDTNGSGSGNSGVPDAQDDLSFDFGFAEIRLDWGDLPDAKSTALEDHYPTNNQDDFGEGIGASHIIVTDMYLGNCVDEEIVGQPSFVGAADEDDFNGVAGDAEGTCSTVGDDEDGINFTTPIIPGQQACMEITVSSVAATGVVNGWIDFNGNSILDDASEQVFTDLDVAGGAGAGTYEHCFTVPAEANVTYGDFLYSRFRLNDDGLTPDDSSALPPTGPADTGEVEDYVLQPFCVGNYLWIDDGATANVQDSTDSPVPAGTVVNLVWAGADGDMSLTADNITYATTTDANSKYHFCGLLRNMDGDNIADDYQIIVPTVPVGGEAAVTADQGGDDTADSDGTIANGNAAEGPIFDVPTSNENLDNQTNDTSGTGTGNSQMADSQDDLSFDFGFSEKFYFDWGDLPDGNAGASANNFPTNNTDGGEGIGPVHTINQVADMYLGNCVDGELDGQPSAAGSANQDDSLTGLATFGTCATAGNDDDGIVFKTPFIAGEQACVDITVATAAAASAVVNGWIDFNSNGILDDAGEQIFTDLDVDAGAGVGTYEHCFTVPTTATHGDFVYSRFRLNDDGFATDDTTALSPTNSADNGEVEDYALALGCVGNYVWFDVGANSDVQDSTDAVYPDLPVSLTWSGVDGLVSTSADNVTYTTTTDENGNYAFCGLVEDPTGDGADQYQISIDLTDTPLTPVTQNSGSDSAIDSDIDATGATAPFTITLPNSVADNAGNDSDPANYTGSATDLAFDIGVMSTRIDLGDLPNNIAGEPNYITVFGNGAAHIIFPDVNGDNIPEPIADVVPVWAGGIVDPDGDGQPTANTDGDDNDGTDDEDGLYIPEFSGIGDDSWLHGESQNFVVTATATAPNHGVEFGVWVDWDEDGLFTGTHEFYTGSITTGTTANGYGVYQGSSVVPVTMPNRYTAGLQTVFVRLRVFPAGEGLAPLSADAVTAVTVGGFEGVAINGEVEDYSTIIPAAPTAVTIQNSGTTANNMSTLLLVLAGVLAILFFTGVGLFARARRK